MESEEQQFDQELLQAIKNATWYHSVELQPGLITPGRYDHRPFLKYYNLPTDLHGKTVLDIGAASGFFSFELESRGGQVTATDLPDWFNHDFGPNYKKHWKGEFGQNYLIEPFEIAKKARNSSVERKLINIYDISPETLGSYDLVFCGSVLPHLTDPIKALWNIASITKEKAIIATVISRIETERPIAMMQGYQTGDTWWIPTQRAFELMVATAGFEGIEWISEFEMTYKDGSPGPYHGVIHAYKTKDNWTSITQSCAELISNQLESNAKNQNSLQEEIIRLQNLVNAYEQGRFIRLMNWLKNTF